MDAAWSQTRVPLHRLRQVARRYFALLATCSMCQAKEGSAAGCPAPLSVLDPHTVLQYLTAGGCRCTEYSCCSSA